MTAQKKMHGMTIFSSAVFQKLLTIKLSRKKLNSIFNETYIADLIERNKIQNESEFEELINILASDIGGLTNPSKLANTFKSLKKVSMHQETIRKYLDYIEDSFLI